jgi:hypothetical protein
MCISINSIIYVFAFSWDTQISWEEMDFKRKAIQLFANEQFPIRTIHTHICMSTLLFLMMTALSIFICVLENIWYKLKFKKEHSNLILLQQTCNSKLRIMKTCYKMRPKFKWHQKLNSTLLSRNIKNPEFFRTSRYELTGGELHL